MFNLFKKSPYNKGFTIAELLIVLGVMGALAILTIPVLLNSKVNENKMLFKKSYYIIERVVNDLINDEEIYPKNRDCLGSGFFNEHNYQEESKNIQIASNLGSVSCTTNEQKIDKTKFCTNFIAKMNTIDDFDCENSKNFNVPNVKPTFMTADGIYWYLEFDFLDRSKGRNDNGDFLVNNYYKIHLDLNGQEKPNCFYNSETCNKPDRFTIHISPYGKLYIEDQYTMNLLQELNSK